MTLPQSCVNVSIPSNKRVKNTHQFSVLYSLITRYAASEYRHGPVDLQFVFCACILVSIPIISQIGHEGEYEYQSIFCHV